MPELPSVSQAFKQNKSLEKLPRERWIRYEVKCSSAISAEDAEERVEGLLKDAYNWYLERKKAQVDLRRWHFVPEVTLDKITYHRYELDDTQTFATLFFPDKEAFIQLLDNFTSGTGKFAVPETNHSLGFLIDGPPGTGKSVIIKATAERMHRHIVDIRLSHILTNHQLHELLFDRQFPTGTFFLRCFYTRQRQTRG